MMVKSDLLTLTTWCHRHDMWWTVTSCEQRPALLLRPRRSRPWQDMLLVQQDGELRLESSAGETLASASGLPALLDAMDGGVAREPPRCTAYALALSVPALLQMLT